MSTYEFISKGLNKNKKGVAKGLLSKERVGKEIRKEIWCRVWMLSFMCSIKRGGFIQGACKVWWVNFKYETLYKFISEGLNKRKRVTKFIFKNEILVF